MKCSKCNFEIRGGKIFDKHFAYCDGTGPRSAKIRKDGGKAWSKGLTAKDDLTLAKISKANTGIKFTGRELQSSTKLKISEGMIKAHAEGRAHNIGSSRWNNLPSYPEQFFMQVIQNEFDDKNYQHEMPFGRYSLDFAWPHLKKVIEIDGEQHQRFEKQVLSDIRKDKALRDNGWQVHRVVWKEMFNHPKEQIAICKKFIGL